MPIIYTYYIYQSAFVTSSRGQMRGLVGLQNLGNTCFINTCVQCLSNLPTFSNFFLNNHHIFKLNKSSSMKGTLALSFGELLHKLCHSSPYSSVSAATLKERVSNFAPPYISLSIYLSIYLSMFVHTHTHTHTHTGEQVRAAIHRV